MNWQLVWLAIIAISVLLLTVIQIVLLLRVARLAQQASAAIEEVRHEIRPLMAKVHQIADDAARTTALALAQVERVDRLMTTTAERVDEAVSTVRSAVSAPIRSGSMLVSGFRAAMAVFAELRKHRRASREDEDAMFVG